MRFQNRLIQLGLLLLILVPFFALGQDSNLDAVGERAGLFGGDLLSIIGNLIKIVLGLTGVIFLVLIIYAGVLWMTAAGEEKPIEKAKNILKSATIGLVITLSAFAITTFIFNNLLNSGDGFGNGDNGSVYVEKFSNSLGNGAIEDHYPTRNQTNVYRNTNIVITFKSSLPLDQILKDYNDQNTPFDFTDDVPATEFNSDNFTIYRNADEIPLTAVKVSYTEDLKTFIINPTEYLGSATEDVDYTVQISSKLQNTDRVGIFVDLNEDGYEWSFQTGTELDLTPPSIESVTPAIGGTYAKNIILQITFDEPVDPTSSSGTTDVNGTLVTGFTNIQVIGLATIPVAGTYALSNGYQTVTFIPTDPCGVNSCGQTIMCLPGNQTLTTTVLAPTIGATPPQVDSFPYDGLVDMAANGFDGNGDGTAGDDYQFSITTTGDIYLDGAEIETVAPAILEGEVSLEQPVNIIFTDVMMSNTLNSTNLTFTNKESTSGLSHEMWYRVNSESLAADGTVIGDTDLAPAKTSVLMSHGVFLESIDPLLYFYNPAVHEGVLNQYQNCYLPASGPSQDGGECAVSSLAPFCCNGNPSSDACNL